MIPLKAVSLKHCIIPTFSLLDLWITLLHYNLSGRARGNATASYSSQEPNCYYQMSSKMYHMYLSIAVLGIAGPSNFWFYLLPYQLVCPEITSPWNCCAFELLRLQVETKATALVALLVVDLLFFEVSLHMPYIFQRTPYSLPLAWRVPGSHCISLYYLGGIHRPLRLLRKENSLERTKKSSCLTVRAHWRLWKCQEPRRHAPGKQPTDATRMSIPRMYNMYLVSGCICDVNM